ncbi:MAG: DNA repair protein RecO, partial [Bacteroidota bacterium]
MIVRTDAVVLRTLDFRETSRIVTLLTRQHGITGVVANGARRTKSVFGSTLQPTAYLQVVYYYKPGRGLQT